MKHIIYTLAILGLIWGLWHFFVVVGWSRNYSEGERTGDVYKFSRKGLIYKSWEGEMYLGGVHSTGGKTPQLQLDVFDFSIPANEETEKADLIAKLQHCAQNRSNETCTVKYRQWFKSPIDVSSEYIVTDVIETKNG